MGTYKFKKSLNDKHEINKINKMMKQNPDEDYDYEQCNEEMDEVGVEDMLEEEFSRKRKFKTVDTELLEGSRPINVRERRSRSELAIRKRIRFEWDYQRNWEKKSEPQPKIMFVHTRFSRNYDIVQSVKPVMTNSVVPSYHCYDK